MPPSRRGMRALTVRDEAAEPLDPRRARSRDLSLPEWERAWGLTARVLHRSTNTPFVRREAIGAGVASAAAYLWVSTKRAPHLAP